jgi:hypothetical protein
MIDLPSGHVAGVFVQGGLFLCKKPFLCKAAQAPRDPDLPTTYDAPNDVPFGASPQPYDAGERPLARGTPAGEAGVPATADAKMSVRRG